MDLVQHQSADVVRLHIVLKKAGQSLCCVQLRLHVPSGRMHTLDKWAIRLCKVPNQMPYGAMQRMALHRHACAADVVLVQYQHRHVLRLDQQYQIDTLQHVHVLGDGADGRLLSLKLGANGHQVVPIQLPQLLRIFFATALAATATALAATPFALAATTFALAAVTLISAAIAAAALNASFASTAIAAFRATAAIAAAVSSTSISTPISAAAVAAANLATTFTAATPTTVPFTATSVSAFSASLGAASRDSLYVHGFRRRC